jgi:hypothetical protein
VSTASVTVPLAVVNAAAAAVIQSNLYNTDQEENSVDDNFDVLRGKL